MPVIRKGENGTWYVWKRKGKPNTNGYNQYARNPIRVTDWEVPPLSKTAQGYIVVGNVFTPPELIGKKIRFVVEVVGEK